MSTATLVPPAQPQSVPAQPQSLADLEQKLAASKSIAWCVIAGLPALGLLVSLQFGLPLFAALMSACFLLGTVLVCHKALATFAGKTLRLLVAARLVIVFVAGAVLFCAGGSAWTGFVSATLLWLVADRLLGRRALHDLWRLVRQPQ